MVMDIGNLVASSFETIHEPLSLEEGTPAEDTHQEKMDIGNLVASSFEKLCVG